MSEKDISNANDCINCEPEEDTPYFRALKESSDLRGKITSLNIFILHNPAFKQLSERQQVLLKQQLDAMLEYFTILDKRLLLWD